MRLLGRLRNKWNQSPLSQRMVALIVFILTLALAVIGTAMIGILQQHLIAQVDNQLKSAVSDDQLQSTVMSSRQGLQQTNPETPSNYYVRTDVLGETKINLQDIIKNRAGEPEVNSLLTTIQNQPTLPKITDPITVSSTQPGANWRVIVAQASFTTPKGEYSGLVTVALPLVDISETLVNTAVYFSMAALAIIITGGVGGYYLVSRSLRPLREIETVAGRIADGDISQRIPPTPPTTEVGSLSLSLNSMLAQIESSFNARDKSEQKIRQFVSDASHELRTPLAAIRGYGELYRMGGVPEERIGDVMGRIESESTRMGSLVEDLLLLARLDEKRDLTLSEVDIVRLVKGAGSDLQALDPKRTVRIHGIDQRRPPASLVVTADRDQITQVVVNLVGNINRYTPEGTPVEMLVGEKDDKVRLEFRDHGPGIAPEDQEKVFERFYRTDTSRARILGGSGLGLSIVSGIVQAHGGSVQLTDTDKGGLTVIVELPKNPPS